MGQWAGYYDDERVIMGQWAGYYDDYEVICVACGNMFFASEGDVDAHICPECLGVYG